MADTEPSAPADTTDEPSALTNVGPRPDAGDPGTAEHQEVLRVLREAGVQANTDDSDTLATKIVNAVRGVTPADDDTDTDEEAEE